jgi:Immunity protein 30
MAINLESTTRQLRDNRLMKNDEQIRLFEEALEQIGDEGEVAQIAALCQGFDDNTEHSEVMFGLVHTIEGYDNISSAEEAMSNFLEAAPVMLPQAADWLRTMLVRILNDANSRLLFSQLLATTNPASQNVIRAALQNISTEDPAKFGDKVKEVM